MQLKGKHKRKKIPFEERTAKKNEVFKTKKTIGFPKAFFKRKADVFSVIDDDSKAFKKNDDGDFGRKETWKSRTKKPNQTLIARSFFGYARGNERYV